MSNRFWLGSCAVLVALVLPQAAESKGAARSPIKAAPKPAAPNRSWGPPGVVWEEGLLRTTAAGAPDLKSANPAQARLGAERASQADAVRRLERLLKTVPIRPGTTVGEALAADATAAAKAEAELKNFRVTDKRYYSDGGQEMDLDWTLAPAVAALLRESAGTVPKAESNYTGLVVDARGLKVKPMLAPRLVDASGAVLYDATMVGEGSLETSGVAVYASSVDEGRASSRTGQRPWVVKATKVKGADFTIEPKAAQALASSPPAFLGEARVVIVLK